MRPTTHFAYEAQRAELFAALPTEPENELVLSEQFLRGRRRLFEHRYGFSLIEAQHMNQREFEKQPPEIEDMHWQDADAWKQQSTAIAGEN